MKTLQEYNDEILKHHQLMNTFPRKNGILCPKCNQEMSDVDNMVLTSYPAKKNVYCESCGHRDYAFC